MSKKTYVKPQILVEEWKVYKETDGYRYGHRTYEVSNFGRVKINGTLIEFNEKQRYYMIGHFFVHKAVAELFIPNPENKPEVDHIDTNKHNNMVWNLRWVTKKENMNNPLTKKQISESLNQPEVKQKRSEIMKEVAKVMLSRSEVRQKRREAAKFAHNSPESRKKQSEAMKDRVCINKNGIIKRVKKDKLSLFLNKGWKFGIK